MTIASGVYYGYDRSGPLVVTQDFDLVVFVASVKDTVDQTWENICLIYQILRILFVQSPVVMPSCRRIYLGGMKYYEPGEEKDDFPQHQATFISKSLGFLIPKISSGLALPSR